MYAIVDVETTGGKFNEEGITEISVYRFDGNEVVDHFASLINPEKEIQPFVVQLTGINNAMLKKAPKFYEIAKRLIEITNDATIVAHNASFDHRMLRLEFERLGYDFQKPTLCTVELAQQLLPEQESFNLGKLTKSLGIPLVNRHRADGDALATVKLFKLLLTKDLKKEIITSTVKMLPVITFTGNHKKIIDSIPSSTGVYYLIDQTGAIINIGSGRNMRKKVTQQLTSKQRTNLRIQNEIYDVKFEKTGNELIASVKEKLEIINASPKYNKKTKKKIYSHGLYMLHDDQGVIKFYIKNINTNPDYIMSFSSKKSADSFLESSVITNEILVHIPIVKSTRKIDSDTLTSISHTFTEQQIIEFNEKAHIFLDQVDIRNKNLLLLDRGRVAGERSVLHIKNGTVLGYGFTNLQIQFKNAAILNKLLTPVEDNPLFRHLFQSYLRHKKNVQVLELHDNF